MRFLLLVLLFSTATAMAQPPGHEPLKARGLWFWGKPASPHGAANVVGDATAETEALDVFARWNVRRLYGSYGANPQERPGLVARWNRRLHDAGIRSESLFSDNEAIAPNGRAGLLQLVDERVLQFNRLCANPRERFDGVALDIEPHATAKWKTATPAARREMLEEFLATCTALRAFLDRHEGRDLTLSAALACWLERMPPEGKVGWKSTEDLENWFARLGDVVPSISLMAYERNRPEAILDAVAWERNHFPGRVITALRARLGVEWSTIADLQRILPRIEAADQVGVDLENYELLRLADTR